MFMKLKKALTPSLSTMIGRQITSHERSGYLFWDEIVLVIDKDYDGPYVSATLKSTNPDAGGISDCNQIWFYKARVGTFSEGFDKLTCEVSAAKLAYPDLEFFRWLKIPKSYTAGLVKEWPWVDQELKAKIVEEGCRWKAETVALFEVYSGGSWAISNHPPWTDNDAYLL